MESRTYKKYVLLTPDGHSVSKEADSPNRAIAWFLNCTQNKYDNYTKLDLVNLGYKVKIIEYTETEISITPLSELS